VLLKLTVSFLACIKRANMWRVLLVILVIAGIVGINYVVIESL